MAWYRTFYQHPKNPWIGFILVLVFGPFGFLYHSWKTAVLIFLVGGPLIIFLRGTSIDPVDNIWSHYTTLFLMAVLALFQINRMRRHEAGERRPVESSTDSEIIEPRSIQEATACIYANAARRELALKNEAPPITLEEFAILYAGIRVAVRDAKESDASEKATALHLLDVYVDDHWAPLLGLNTTARDVTARMASEPPAVSQERAARLREHCRRMTTVLLDATTIVKMVEVAGPETTIGVLDAAQEYLATDEKQPDDVRRHAIELLSGEAARLARESRSE